MKDPTAVKKKKKKEGTKLKQHQKTSCRVCFTFFAMNKILLITTCACVGVTCKAGTYSSLLCGQAGVFFVLDRFTNKFLNFTLDIYLLNV